MLRLYFIAYSWVVAVVCENNQKHSRFITRDFSRPSPVSTAFNSLYLKFAGGIHASLKYKSTGSGSGTVICRHFENGEIARFWRPKGRIANPQISRGSGAQTTAPGYTDRCATVLHATIPSSLGPARKHTAKFEPAAWSWAQMTSGSGAPKRVLSEGTITFKRLWPN